MVFPPRRILRSGAPDAATTTADAGGVEVPYRLAISSEEEAEAEAAADAAALLRGEQVDEEDEEEEEEAEEDEEEDDEEVTQAKPQP